MKEIEKLFKTEFDYVEEFRLLARKLSKTFRSFPLFVVAGSSDNDASFHHYGRTILATASKLPTDSNLSHRPSQNRIAIPMYLSASG